MSSELKPYKLIFFDRDIAFATTMEALIPENFPGP